MTRARLSQLVFDTLDLPDDAAPRLLDRFHDAGEVEMVLGALGVDRIDVFLLHRDDTALPVAAWADALLAEVEAGASSRSASRTGRSG
jgi:aryl-alcohol dehydrogenase-like predicted oxidoreductase